MQQASATGKTEEPEATRTITLLVTCRQASSIIGEMGRRKKSIQDVTNTWVCICGTDDCIVLTLRVLVFTSAGIIFANACTNGICIAGAGPDKPRQHRGHHPTTQSSPSSGTTTPLGQPSSHDEGPRRWLAHCPNPPCSHTP